MAQPPGAALAGRLVHRGLLLAESMGAIGPVVVLYMLPFAVVMVLLAVRIWQAAAHPVPMTNPEQAGHAGQLARSGKGI